MSAATFKAVASAFNREKPHSSVSDWVDILTSSKYEDEAYDGIPEVVDVINLQSTGPTEASRAIRKKLKHGTPHQQYRALVILGALVVNCGHKFQTTFADGQMTDAIKQLATDPTTDLKVKKKLMSVLASWHAQFKDDPSMSLVAGLYKQYKPADRRSRSRDVTHDADVQAMLRQQAETDKRKKEKEEKEAAKRNAKEAARDAKEKARRDEEKARKDAEEARRRKNRPKRAPFDFEKEKPQILTTIANTSQAANNLVNAITLVNSETDSITTNVRVQECLNNAKLARKPIVRYIQLVENEEVIGTLIETNERIIASLEMYDKLSTPTTAPAEVDSAITAGLAAAHITNPSNEITKLQAKQRAAVSRAVAASQPSTSSELHPDLMDLTFGSATQLPSPLQPSDRNIQDDDSDRVARYYGNLSDFSDYDDDSSPESQGHVGVSDDDSVEEGRSHPKAGPSGTHATTRFRQVEEDDPFADPFAG